MQARLAVLGLMCVLVLGLTAVLAQPPRADNPPAQPAARPPTRPPEPKPAAPGVNPKAPATTKPGPGPGPTPAEPGPIPPERQMLAHSAGEFEVKLTVYLEPGGEPVILKGTATRELILGGMFLLERLESRDEQRPFAMMSTIGFNADAHDGPRFEIVRHTSLAPCAMPEAGKWDAEKHTLTSRGEHELAGMGVRVRVIEHHESDDRFTLEMRAAYEGYSEQFKDLRVPEYKTMVLEYQRKR